MPLFCRTVQRCPSPLISLQCHEKKRLLNNARVVSCCIHDLAKQRGTKTTVTHLVPFRQEFSIYSKDKYSLGNPANFPRDTPNVQLSLSRHQKTSFVDPCTYVDMPFTTTATIIPISSSVIEQVDIPVLDPRKYHGRNFYHYREPYFKVSFFPPWTEKKKRDMDSKQRLCRFT